MKRLIFIFLTTLVFATNASNVSDSMFFTVPPEYYSYYMPAWCNDSLNLIITDTINHAHACWGGSKNITTGIGQGFYSPTDIRIKGVAIGHIFWVAPNNMYRDTNVNYELDVSILKVIDENSVQYYGHTSLNTTVDHFSNTILITNDTLLTHTIPLYEVYFESAIVVSDTFFCMVDALVAKQDTSFFNDKIYYSSCIALSCNYSDTLLLSGIPHLITLYHADLSSENVFFDSEWVVESFRSPYSRSYFLIFPILDLGDSAGVEEVDAVGRNTAVWPNPTRGTISVASGYGLKRVTVHDIGGRLVLSREASGLSTSIDVSPLPRGAYFVTVETLVGTTTKKLLVE